MQIHYFDKCFIKKLISQVTHFTFIKYVYLAVKCEFNLSKHKKIYMDIFTFIVKKFISVSKL